MSRYPRFREPFLPATMRSWRVQAALSCSRSSAMARLAGGFLAPDFIKTMLMQVGEGKTVLLGTPL
jgi:hypothetical protein